MRSIALEDRAPTRIAVALSEWERVPGHVWTDCATELDGGPACPACLAYRLRAYTRADDR